MNFTSLSTVGLFLSLHLGFCSSLNAADKELKAVLDFQAKPRLLDTHFTRFGPSFVRTVTKDTGGTRIRIPADKKFAGQAGMYSYFAMAGDIEVSANFELIQLQPPQDGYGASIGIVLDAEGEVGAVSLSRGYHPNDGQGFWVSRSTPTVGGETKYATEFFGSTGKRGQLVLHRAGDKITSLVADTPSGKLRELTTTPFTSGTVRQFRLYADTGGSLTAIDVRITNVLVRAEELTGGIPEMESRGSWWLTLMEVLVGVGIVFGTVRYFRKRWRSLR